MSTLEPHRLKAAALAALLALGGCAGPGGRATVRMIDGRPQASRYVGPAAYGHFIRGEIALGRGQPRRAVEHFRLALSFDQRSPYLYTRVAAALLTADKDLGGDQRRRRAGLRRIEAHLERALELRPGFPEALLLLATTRQRAGDPSGALTALRRCVADNPREAEAYVRLAELLQRDQRAEEARRVLETMRQRLPADRRTHRAWATLCLRQLDYPCAARALRQAIQRRATITALVELAAVERARGAGPAAVRALREAFDRSDGHPRAARLLAAALADLGRVKEVDDLIDLLERASHGKPARLAELARVGLRGRRPATVLATLAPHLRAAPDEPTLLLAQARALESAGRSAEALAVLRRPSLAEGPTGVEAAVLAAEVARPTQGRRACRGLEAAIRRHGPRERLLVALSTCLGLSGDAQGAVATLERSLDKRPHQRGSFTISFALAMALERAGKIKRALATIDQLARRRPNNPTVLNFIGFALADHDIDLGRAERALRRALHLAPARSYIIDSLGWLLFRRGRLADAARVLRYASRLAPHAAEILGHLADVEAALRRSSAAARLYRRALDLSRDPRLTRSLRARLDRLQRRQLGQRR